LNEAKDKIQKEAIDELRNNNFNGLVILPTGTGKGKIMVDSCLELGSKSILYLCNTTALRDTMFKDELRKWNASHLIDCVDYMCYQSACKLKNVNYDILLADEFDAALTPQYIKAITNNIFKYKILISATLEDDKKRKALKIAPIVYEKKIRDVIEAKALNKQKFYFVNYNLTEPENKRYLEFNNSFIKLLNQPRNKAVSIQLDNLKIYRKQFLSKLSSSVEVTKWLIKNLDKPTNKILIFTGLSDQADRICPPYSFHSKNDTEGLKWFNAFNNGTINKLAVVNKVDRGLNINGINNIIYNTTDSSKTKLVQRGGRGMRLEVDQYLNMYFLIPFYKTQKGERKPTIVQSWVIKGTADFDVTKATNINYA
jgi:superfamily II DNA or RNA helicase